ncbi:hypothetical protein B0A49_06563 [Cryomyces minteri]|uniref:Uncharacterized protein n=1 Tax=Cryomyces minteri TaxID=331657 RepID=A0A4U0WVU2_9PEZI|nr:hypothetical protein B0A49_06563 [Cryomyces minteri]
MALSKPARRTPTLCNHCSGTCSHSNASPIPSGLNAPSLVDFGSPSPYNGRTCLLHGSDNNFWWDDDLMDAIYDLSVLTPNDMGYARRLMRAAVDKRCARILVPSAWDKVLTARDVRECCEVAKGRNGDMLKKVELIVKKGEGKKGKKKKKRAAKALKAVEAARAEENVEFLTAFRDKFGDCVEPSGFSTEASVIRTLVRSHGPAPVVAPPLPARSALRPSASASQTNDKNAPSPAEDADLEDCISDAGSDRGLLLRETMRVESSHPWATMKEAKEIARKQLRLSKQQRTQRVLQGVNEFGDKLLFLKHLFKDAMRPLPRGSATASPDLDPAKVLQKAVELEDELLRLTWFAGQLECARESPCPVPPNSPVLVGDATALPPNDPSSDERSEETTAKLEKVMLDMRKHLEAMNADGSMSAFLTRPNIASVRPTKDTPSDATIQHNVDNFKGLMHNLKKFCREAKDEEGLSHILANINDRYSAADKENATEFEVEMMDLMGFLKKLDAEFASYFPPTEAVLAYVRDANCTPPGDANPSVMSEDDAKMIACKMEAMHLHCDYLDWTSGNAELLAVRGSLEVLLPEMQDHMHDARVAFGRKLEKQMRDIENVQKAAKVWKRKAEEAEETMRQAEEMNEDNKLDEDIERLRKSLLAEKKRQKRSTRRMWRKEARNATKNDGSMKATLREWREGIDLRKQQDLDGVL